MEPELEALMAAAEEFGYLAYDEYDSTVEARDKDRVRAAVEREAAAFALRLLDQPLNDATTGVGIVESLISARDRWRKVLEAK